MDGETTKSTTTAVIHTPTTNYVRKPQIILRDANSSYEEEMDGNVKKMEKDVLTPPCNYIQAHSNNNKINNSQNMNGGRAVNISSQQFSNEESSSDEQQHYKEHSLLIKKQTLSDKKNSNHVVQREVDDTDITEQVSDILTATESPECHTCCNACRNVQNVILKYMKQIMKKEETVINLISNSESMTYNNNEAVTNLLPNFPFSTLEEFQIFDADLRKDAEIRKQFKAKIVAVGGSTFAKHVRNILKLIMTDELCRHLSWTGNKGSIPIKDSDIATLIIGYIADARKCSIYEVQKTIQEWLRHASDRIRHLKKK